LVKSSIFGNLSLLYSDLLFITGDFKQLLNAEFDPIVIKIVLGRLSEEGYFLRRLKDSDAKTFRLGF